MKKAISFLLVSLMAISCHEINKSGHPSGDEIVLDWEFMGNNPAEHNYSSVFTLENKGRHSLGNSGWELYFSQMGGGFIEQSVTGNVRIEHVNGDLSRIVPAKDFLLEPGQRVKIGYKKRGSLIKENEAPLGPYMVYNENRANTLIFSSIAEYTIKPFPSLEQIFPPEMAVPIPDASWVYDQNLHQVLLKAESAGKVIPSPLKAEYGAGKVTLAEGLMIHFMEGCEMEAGYLSEMLKHCMGVAPAVMQSSSEGTNIIRLIKSDEPEAMETEEYLLTAEKEKGIVIVGGSAAGVFYGIQSLLSLLPVESWARPMNSIEIQAISIYDKPAFEYRGMHLDIARNFIEPAAIKKLIEIMGYYKLNKLHLHLSDDEGWRIEIPGLPELTEVGGYRGFTLDSKDHLPPAYGSGPEAEQGVGHGSGYLSRDTFIEILQFAQEHHIEVIPEINFPGHARAAIYAMENRYDRLMKEGNEEEALQFRLIDPGDQSRYNSAQDYNDNVICVCQEAPYHFYEAVVDEIMKMYEEAGLKLRVIHAGGDEVPRGAWTDSPVCDQFLREHPEIGEAENLQAYFEEQLFEMLSKKNLVMAGWEEIAMKKNEQGDWIPNPELVGANILPYVWNCQDEYLDLGNRLANAGYPIILCNVTNYYFDLAYNHHPKEPGHYWGGYVNTRRAFEFVPYHVFNSTLTDKYWRPVDTKEAIRGREPLKTLKRKNIVGIQGQLWSEYVKGSELMEYLLAPKIIGLAERAWAGQQNWGEIADIEQRITAMNKAWNEFANVLGKRELPRLDHIFGGFNYRLPPPGAKMIEGKLYANIDFPGLTIGYTTDGSDPETDSPVYTGPVDVSGSIRLRSFDSRGRGSRVSVVE